MAASKACDSFHATRRGFHLVRAGESHEYSDQDVVGLSIRTRREADELGRTAVIKSLQFRFDDSTECAVVENELGPQEEDALQPLEQRLVGRLVKRAWASLRRGEDVSGEGWTLNLIEFFNATANTYCDLQQITGVTWEADDLCIWHEDDAEVPLARIPRSAENAVVLHRLLSYVFTEVSPDSSRVANLGMGRRLAEFTTQFRPAVSNRAMAVVVGITLAVMLATLTLYATALGALLLLMLVLTAAPLLTERDETLRFFEHGLIWSSGHDEQVLLVDQIRSVTVCQSIDVPAAKTTGRPVVLEFCSTDRSTPTLRATIDTNAKGLTLIEPLLSRITHRIKQRMREQVVGTGRVHWTPNIEILRDGLRLRMGESSQRRDVRFDQISDWQRVEDRLTISTSDQTVAISESTATPNFLPGYELFQELSRQR